MDWHELKTGVYDPDGSLRDIYVLNISREDWKKWADYVSANYQVSWYAEGYTEEAATDKIDSGFIDHRWNSERYVTTARVFLDKVQVNCHFFVATEIENDIDPKQINSLDDHHRLLDYMKAVSKLLGKEVILTDENMEESIWIKVNGDDVRFIG